jgi:hypothetical protein
MKVLGILRGPCQHSAAQCLNLIRSTALSEIPWYSTNARGRYPKQTSGIFVYNRANAFKSIFNDVRHILMVTRSESRNDCLRKAWFSTTRKLCAGDSRSDVFVSDHFRIPRSDLDKLVKRMGWKAMQRGEWLDVELCPSEVCQGTRQQQSSKGTGDNAFTFGINVHSGSYQCFRCKATGSWLKLKKHLNEAEIGPLDKASVRDQDP